MKWMKNEEKIKKKGNALVVVYTAQPWEFSNRKLFFEALVALGSIELVVIDRPRALVPDTLRKKFYQGSTYKSVNGVHVLRPITLLHDHVSAIPGLYFLNALNAMLINTCIRKYLKRCQVDWNVSRIYWLYEQIHFFLAEADPNSPVIWEIFDDYRLRADGRKRMRWAIHDKRARSRSAYIVTLTELLAEKYRDSRCPVLTIGNGYSGQLVRGALAKQQDQPGTAESGSVLDYLANHKRKLVGYAGVIRDWLDFELIDDLCGQNPDCDFVFLGPIVQNVRRHVNRLENTHSNFYHFDQVDRATAYYFASRCTATLLPYLTTEFTLGVKPIKMIESLAVGTPVLTTLSSDIAEFGACVRFLPDVASAGRIIGELDTIEVREMCLAVAAPYSWENIAKRIAPIIHELSAQGGAS